MYRSLITAACAAAVLTFAAPMTAFAGDASETSDHSGKQADGKTNGMTDTSAEKIGEQQKQPAKVQNDNNSSAPAKAGVAQPDGKKSP